MKNTIEIDGYEAVARFDPDIDMFRGEFVGLNGGADFYAPDVAGLGKEGAASLETFLEMCEEDGVAPRRPCPAKLHPRRVSGSERGRGQRNPKEIGGP